VREDRQRRSSGLCLLIFSGITIFNTLLARFGVIARPIGLGSSGLYFSVAFMIVFALWFGGWGVLAAYIGCYLGAGWLGGMPHAVNLYWSLADVWQVIIPLAAFRMFRADVGLRTMRDVLTFLGFGWLLNNLAGAAWGASTLALGGLAAWNDVPGIFSGWLVGNLIVTMAITPIVLRYGTGYLHARERLVHQYWA
jgi:hypothetical protein